MAAKKVLGRGLEALIPDLSEDQESKQSVLHVPIEHISANPYQPRHSFDQAKLDELARSILEKV